jgi:hypothetical protein
MNREQKRAFVKRAKKRGTDEKAAKAYAEIISNGAGKTSPKQDIVEDEKVKLNVENLKARQNYARMSDTYKEFIDANIDTVFTAHVERPTLISLKEEPKWLFWCGDLIKVKEEE